ncbi:MAG: M24 family metallopeptidase [Saprospiraceae bacterium]|nr:M24 family metallopeptidase [Saprospiraceae bacterium]
MRLISILFGCIIGVSVSAQQISEMIMSQKDRAVWVDSMLEYRMEKLLPELMRRAEIDMWVIISREYNEDPVMKTMLPATWLSARRRTMMVFYDPGNGQKIEKVAIARYDVGRLLHGEWNIDVYPDQWEAFTNLIEKYQPNKIGINTSEYFGLADGLVASEKENLINALPQKYKSKIVSAEKLALSWLETRTDMELEFYKALCNLSRNIIKEGFDPNFIKTGMTTTDDIVWKLRQIVTDYGLDVWFHPTVSIQGEDKNKFDHVQSFSGRPKDQVIQFGDLLHVDFGITYNRLNTDQQQHFYVLRPDENEIPKGLQKAFATANRLQDILTSQFSVTKSGNEILSNALKVAKQENITASIYTHPIGFHGHAAGPTIGLWDQQNGVKGAGDYIVYPNTAYSIELNATSEINEWGKIVRIMLEEDGYFDGSDFKYFAGRQEEIYKLRLK